MCDQINIFHKKTKKNKQIFACLFSVNRVMIILLLEKLILAETAFIRIVMQLDAEIK